MRRQDRKYQDKERREKMKHNFIGWTTCDRIRRDVHHAAGCGRRGERTEVLGPRADDLRKNRLRNAESRTSQALVDCRSGLQDGVVIPKREGHSSLLGPFFLSECQE